MFEKEKTLLAFLGVLVSLALLAAIIVWGTDFTDLKLKLMGEALMEQIKVENYAEVYNEFTEEYDLTLNQFIEEQKRVKMMLGNLGEYQFTSIYKDKGLGNVFLLYKAGFTDYPEKKINCKWKLCRTQKGWKVKDFQLETDDVLIQKKLNSKMGEEESPSVINAEQAKQFALQMLEEYKNKKYSTIYASFGESIRERGDKACFIQYMEMARKTYGVLDKLELVDQEFSKDKKEIKLRFQGFSNTENRKIGIIMWVGMGDSLHLTGFQFSNNSW